MKLPVRIPHLIAGVLLLCVARCVAGAVMIDDPFGGERMAVVSADQRVAPAKKDGDAKDEPKAEVAANPAAPAADTTPDNKTVTIIDGQTGKRQEVKVGGVKV